jgi:hypothetical protein
VDVNSFRKINSQMRMQPCQNKLKNKQLSEKTKNNHGSSVVCAE